MGGFIGSMIGAGVGAIEQNQANQANIGLQNAAENWETSMSDTALQRGVADAKAAGLNPMLVAGNGGASTPGAPMANVQSAMPAIAAGANTAMSAMSMASQIDANKASAYRDRTAGVNNLSQSMKASNDAAVTAQTTESQVKAAAARAAIADAAAFSAKNVMSAESNAPSVYGNLDAILGRANVGINAAGSMLNLAQ